MIAPASSWLVPSLGLFIGVLGVAGCGSGGGALFDGGGASDSGSGRGDGGTESSTLMLGGDGGSGPSSDGAVCAADHAKGTPSPAYLVFIMDRSDSMSADSKWTSCSAALDSFFSSTMTTALSASLTWLPFVPKGEMSTSKDPEFSCTVTDYETPAVPMTALPSTAFATAIAATSLEFGTPTLTALTGTVEYATTIQKAHPGGKVLIVLATDGLPYGCTGDTVAAVAAEAATALSTYKIPTYVIGVGGATTNLDAIAVGGGTKAAFIVPTSDPSMTTKVFEAAIQTIQGSLGCDYPIPAPSGGEMIDYTKVNVELTGSGGKETELTYSADCSNADGWHYDDASAPTEIILCSGACTQAEAAKMGSIDILFGCQTNGLPPK